jgi:hypothetical protein
MIASVPLSIRDEENTVLKRYAMFSLIYKIKNFGGMKPPGGKSEKSRSSDRSSDSNKKNNED